MSFKYAFRIALGRVYTSSPVSMSRKRPGYRKENFFSKESSTRKTMTSCFRCRKCLILAIMSSGSSKRSEIIIINPRRLICSDKARNVDLLRVHEPVVIGSSRCSMECRWFRIDLGGTYSRIRSSYKINPTESCCPSIR